LKKSTKLCGCIVFCCQNAGNDGKINKNGLNGEIMGKRKLFVFLGCVLAWWPFLLNLPQDSKKEYKYVASKFSVAYHLPTCKRAKRIQAENRVFFASAEEAIKAGYVPCGLCKPHDKGEEIQDPATLIPVPTN
jgi:hypothetical protein